MARKVARRANCLIHITSSSNVIFPGWQAGRRANAIRARITGVAGATPTTVLPGGRNDNEYRCRSIDYGPAELHRLQTVGLGGLALTKVPPGGRD